MDVERQPLRSSLEHENSSDDSSDIYDKQPVLERHKSSYLANKGSSFDLSAWLSKRPSTRPQLPSSIELITYLCATFLVGYIGYAIGKTYEHQHDLIIAYSSGISGLVADEQYHEVHTALAPTIDAGAPREKLAFAAFLGVSQVGTAGHLITTLIQCKQGWSPDNQEKINDEDSYYISVRILTYQFLHDPMTKTDPDIPFLVLTMPEVDEWKKEQLRRDGATVVPIERTDTGGKGYRKGRWKVSANTPNTPHHILTPQQDVFSKLEIFRQIQYSRICFVDADTTLVAPMTDIFNDPAAQIRITGHNESALWDDEAPLPREYLMAAKTENSGHVHNHIQHPAIPPASAGRKTKRSNDWQDASSDGYFNAGFLVIKVSSCEVF